MNAQNNNSPTVLNTLNNEKIQQNFIEDLHVAIIMDGNGRWATNKKLDRTAGHIAGVETLKTLLYNLPTEIKILTVYAFSLENWSRSVKEVYNLMKIANDFLQMYLSEFIEKSIKVQFIGDIDILPFFINNMIKKVTEKTKYGTKLIFNIAISYGSRQEILNAFAKYLQDNTEKKLDKKLFEQYLSTNGMPDPHILIRTGGEKRLSNYLLWQLAYTELFFIDTLWPDFQPVQLKQIVQDFQKINRRFGFAS